MRYFRHIHLENWRNFGKVDVELQNRVVLVGPNASGKSNFLDVFRFLYDLVSIGGGFQEAVRKRGGISKLRYLGARQYSDITVAVTIASDDELPVWQYRLSFNQDRQRRPVIKQESVIRDGVTILQRPDEADEKDTERLTQTYLEQVLANQDYRDIATFFASVRYQHIVPQLVREPDRSVGRKNDPYGGDFLEQIARAAERTQKSRLKQIGDALKVAVPQLEEIEMWKDERGTPHLRGRYRHWRDRGAWLNEDQLSDGTLRLMGLLWTILDGNGPLLLEEPELSLHPAVVRVLPQMFARVQRQKKRQVMISTHSSEMLGDEGIGLDETLLFEPKDEGTSIRPAGEYDQVRTLLEGGVSLADAVLPITNPPNPQQLAFFADAK